MQFDSEDSYENIPALKFVAADNFLKNQDRCFCMNGINGALTQADGCLFSGALDLSSCLGKKFYSNFRLNSSILNSTHID